MSDTWAPVEGKYGLTRDGRKAGPIEKNHDSFFVWQGFIEGHGRGCWKPNGVWGYDGENDLDLISEWVEPVAERVQVKTTLDLISEWVEPVAEPRKVKTGDKIRIRHGATGNARQHIGKVVKAFIVHDGETRGYVDGCQPFILYSHEWEFADAPESESAKEQPQAPATPAFPIDVWDRYASAALHAFISEYEGEKLQKSGESLFEAFSRLSADCADVMMAERAKRLNRN